MLPSDDTNAASPRLPHGSETRWAYDAAAEPVTAPDASRPSPSILRRRFASIAPRPSTPILAMTLVVIALVAGGALFLSGYSLGRQQATTPGTPVTEEQAFQPFWDAYRAVTERYAGGPVDRKALIEGAIKGMIAALGDPFSSYLTSDEYKQSLQGISGEFEGIGAQIGTEKADGTSSDCSTLGPDCRLVVVAPIAGSPADKAGLQPADVIAAIDGKSLDGLTVDAARNLIRGPKGTAVTLSIVRKGGAPKAVRIVRDTIIQQEVVARDLANNSVGYIQLSGFSDHATDQVRTVLAADVAKGEKKIILDLRGNPGGFVTAARAIASQFIASGPIYWQEDATGHDTEVEAQADGVATDPGIKVVVLIDKGSASASEIVAGALQDTKRATLVGEQSYGKGTVQQWLSLEQDSGGFRLTIAKWLTPDKRWINGKGLTPDVAVTVPANNPAGTDPVLDKAVEILTGTAIRLPAAA
jgi:carboxyl-terminal processing protease